MNYFLSDEQKQIKKLARKIAEEKIVPIRAELDEKAEFSHEIMQEIAKIGLFSIFVPEEYEGLGGGILDFCIAVEELSRACSGVAVSYAGSGLGTYPILIAGNPEQKKKYLPSIASGEKLAAFGLTEANAGSDASNVQTTAVLDGDSYILNGTKQFITNGGVADIYTIIASTNPKKGARGLSAFIVEKGTSGFTFGKEENKMGIRASATSELLFENCRVPKENLLGKEGRGFLTAMRLFEKTRPCIGAQAVGIAQGAYEEAARHARERVQFGKTIINFQAIQFMLADMATQIEAARAFVYAVSRWIDSGAKNVGKVSSMTKVFASDMCMRVTTDAVQIFGGYGYMRDYPVEKMMRDAKITQIYEGTNQIQRLVIGSSIMKGDI